MPRTKNGSSREVPLSRRAELAVQMLMRQGVDPIVSRDKSAISKMFRWYVEKALPEHPELADLHFHDLRHEATWRLSEKVTVLELAKITGHKNLASLMTYYNPTGTELAEKLR